MNEGSNSQDGRQANPDPSHGDQPNRDQYQWDDHRKYQRARQVLRDIQQKWRDDVSFDRKVEHILNTLVFLSASAAAIFAFWQFREMRRTTDATLSTLKSQRAFLEVGFISSTDMPSIDANFSMNVPYQNRGASPAVRIEPKMGLAMVENATPAELEQVPRLELAISDLGPSSSSNLWFQHPPWSLGETASFQSGALEIVAVGTFLYADAFGCRLLRFCKKFRNVQSSAKWELCTSNNFTEDVPCPNDR